MAIPPRLAACREQPISIVSAADDKYALPLAVTIRSAIDSVGRNQRVDVYILDGGLSNDSKARLLRSWQAPNVNVSWLSPPIAQIADLKTDNHLNLVTYLRLFMPSLLPQQLERVIFLDADLLIQNDISKLWNTELGDAPIAAVIDYATPYLNTRETIGRASFCDRNPEKCQPVPNYRELGLKGSAGYFNAGVMVVNLKKWREIDILRKATDIVRKHTAHVRYCDQYALNILFSEKWKPLDPRWNQNTIAWAWKDDTESPFDAGSHRLLRKDPWIVHFTWINKPWHPGSTPPYPRRFFKVVDRTDWLAWRPEGYYPPLPQRISNAYKAYRVWYRQTISPVEHKLKAALGRKKRAA